ncbi:ATP-grasp domain-containing protein [Streptomyces sp. NPDC052676]|uniref:carboxylate--amine ligase n=1 Tax=Streptomyces sp. NPDC052676 TaxID=3154953 RepID=UPI00341C7A3B
MSLLDTRIPAVLLRTDRNPFHHGTLGAVRSLGRAGVDVHLVADGPGRPVARSRFVLRLHTPPAPDASTDEIAAVLRRVAAEVARPAVLLPMDDASAVAVGRLRAELAPAYLLPTHRDLLPEHVADKAELAGVCAALNVPHPVTVVPDSAAQAAATAWRLGLPVVAKWSRPWLLPAGTGLCGTALVRSPREARELYARTAEAGSPLLLQEFLPPGPDRDWFVHAYVARCGTLTAGGTGRRLRSWPADTGRTAVGVWTPHPRLWDLTTRLVGELGYRGVLDLDLRRCARTGRYHLLDFNPRPGAEFRLFTDTAGLDVVRALHLDVTHRAPHAGAACPGRTFVVENHAPLCALRPAPGGRELAWHAADDLAPGLAMWALWSGRASHRLRARLRPARSAAPGRVRVPAARQGDAPPVTGLPDEKANRP